MNIPAKYLKAALLFASKKDVRYYLNGVLFEVLNGQARLVATDDIIIGVFRLGECSLPDTQIIIPRERLETIKLKDGEVTLRPGDGKTCALVYAGNEYTFTAIDGRFPDYRRVIPSGVVSGESAQFSSELIVVLDKAYKVLNPASKWGTPYISHNGSRRGALVDLKDDNVLGVIMPLNLDAKGARPLRTEAWI